MTVTEWVIGRGLLGSAIARELKRPVFSADIAWNDPKSAVEDLRNALGEFLAAEEGDWAIYWCAGRGVTSASVEDMNRELSVFRAFVEALTALPPDKLQHGRFFLASSVGGAYAGSKDPPFTEATPPAPLVPYGRAKLAMEDELNHAGAAGLKSFIARITNLYGPDQDMAKGQGLISVIVDSYVTGRPVQIYVSLDTLRDYIYVDDCAKVITAAMDRLRREPAGTVVTKIVGAMNALSIGAIIGEMSRLRRKPVPIVTGQGNSTGQASDLRVRSTVWPELDNLVSTTVPAGLGAIYRAQLASHILS